MEHFEAADTGGAREEAGVARGQVKALVGLVAIRIEKARLAIEQVGVLRERDDARRVLRIEAGVDDVRDALARLVDDQRVLEVRRRGRRDAGRGRNENLLGVAAVAYRGLELREPRTGLPAGWRRGRPSARSDAAAH